MKTRGERAAQIMCRTKRLLNAAKEEILLVIGK